MHILCMQQPVCAILVESKLVHEASLPAILHVLISYVWPRVCGLSKNCELGVSVCAIDPEHVPKAGHLHDWV